MNILQSSSYSDKSIRNGQILPFYTKADLDSVSEEISIDKFEEYANYRMDCIIYVYSDDDI